MAKRPKRPSARTFGRLGFVVLLVVLLWPSDSKRTLPANPAPIVLRIAQYLDDSGYRLRRLSQSLRYATNTDYAKRRIDKYARWEQLEVWNPPTRLAPETSFTSLDVPTARQPYTLLEVGKKAFWSYPVQLSYAAEHAKPEHGLDTYVEVKLPDGGTMRALTCASCHSYRGVPGVPSQLDLGRLLVDSAELMGGRAEENSRARHLLWGPSRVDVTTSDGSQPVRIGDLRVVRDERYLHHAATVAHDDEIALALRIETLMTTGQDELLRPPREVALGLALYVLSLADTLPKIPDPSDFPVGSRIFDQRCATCHVPPTFEGEPVEAARVGTDPLIAHTRDRGRGVYRVPSLRGSSTRGLLLHDTSVADLETLFSPLRKSHGHYYGTDLAANERHALLEYIEHL